MITGLGLPLQDDDARHRRQFGGGGDSGDAGADDDDICRYSHLVVLKSTALMSMDLARACINQFPTIYNLLIRHMLQAYPKLVARNPNPHQWH